MSYTRKKFLYLISGVFFVPSMILNACTWNKKKQDPEPDPSPPDDPSEPYTPPPGQSLMLIMEEELVYSGEELEIQWQQTGLTAVNLYFSSDNGMTWNPIADNVGASLASYSWTIPTLTSSFCLLRITNADDEQLKSQSVDHFRIAVIMTVDLTLYPSLQTVGGFEIIDLFYDIVFIIRESGTDFKIISMHCTHNGCIINYNGNPGFNCSCHGSQFNAEGMVIQGPADKNLPRFSYNYSSVDNNLRVTM